MKNLTKLYFTLVSLVSIIGLAIGYGISGYNYFMSHYITDDEYIAKQYYQFDQCDQPNYAKATTADQNPVMRTDAEKATCKQDARKQVLLTRSVNTKENVIGGLVR
jgi:hypothetical protein